MHFLRKKVRNNLQMSKKSRIFVVAFGKLRQMLLFAIKRTAISARPARVFGQAPTHYVSG